MTAKNVMTSFVDLPAYLALEAAEATLQKLGQALEARKAMLRAKLREARGPLCVHPRLERRRDRHGANRSPPADGDLGGRGRSVPARLQADGARDSRRPGRPRGAGQRDGGCRAVRNIETTFQGLQGVATARNLRYARAVALRRGDEAAIKATMATPGHYGAERPLAAVQIDHTRVDVVAVDEETREPIGRPWITLRSTCSRAW